jgi:hypothetical protein
MAKRIIPEDDFDDHIVSNPLAKYFRAPGVHVRLPTNGVFMPPGSVSLTLTGELPVFPMRAADELLLKSPDALMSGYAIEKLIESCVPAIKHPRLISSPDLDVILLAIRAATYGEMITTTATCSDCGTETQTQCNLSNMIANMTMVDPENVVRLSDEMVVFLRPYNMTNATTLGVASFEEMRKVQAVETAEPDVRREQVNSSMQRLSHLATMMMADCIVYIVIPEGNIADPVMIREFLDNVSKEWTDRLQTKLDTMNNAGIDKSYEVTCEKCSHKWKTQIEFDPATFFAAAS